MAIERVEVFIAEEEDLIIYNAKAIINFPFAYFYDDLAEEIFDFPGYISPYLYVFNERMGTLLKSYTSQLIRNSNIIIMNASVPDMTFDDCGKYYYEKGYIQSGGYEVPLRYGNLFVK